MTETTTFHYEGCSGAPVPFTDKAEAVSLMMTHRRAGERGCKVAEVPGGFIMKRVDGPDTELWFSNCLVVNY